MPLPLKKRKVDTENAAIAKRGNYTQTLDAIVEGGFCPFCEEHLSKHHRRPILYKSRYWLVTENAWPYKGSRFHFLFIARPHIEAMEDMSSAMWTDLQKLYRKLVKENSIRGGTLMIRSGDTKATGASVNHLHAHLIVGVPRTKNTKSIEALVGFKK
ncbi:MAG: HIT domain-containing protein [Candidatus Kaiserbacteria bacterium]|nr:HIT domain-containing protein [Candidatus Kaiserbacteria bacterium]